MRDITKYQGVIPAFYACYDEKGDISPEGVEKLTRFLIEKGVAGEELCKVIAQAQEERTKGTQVLVARMNKNKKFQKEQLMKEGWEEFREFYQNPLK